eukprot:13041209-Heterocapsa_arctica.AAC.1
MVQVKGPSSTHPSSHKRATTTATGPLACFPLPLSGFPLPSVLVTSCFQTFFQPFDRFGREEHALNPSVDYIRRDDHVRLQRSSWDCKDDSRKAPSRVQRLARHRSCDC